MYWRQEVRPLLQREEGIVRERTEKIVRTYVSVQMKTELLLTRTEMESVITAIQKRKPGKNAAEVNFVKPENADAK